MKLDLSHAWADPHNQHCPIHDLLTTFIRNESVILENYFAEDVRFYLHGEGPRHGEYDGREAVVSLIRQRQEALADRPYDVKVLSLSESNGHVAANVEVHTEAEGSPFEWHCVWVCLLWQGRVSTMGLYVDRNDQPSFDRFWNRVLGPPVEELAEPASA